VPPAEPFTRVPHVRLLVRAGCHLCEEARPLVARLAREAGAEVEELDVDDDDALFEAYSDLVPVVLVDGVEQGRWRLEPDRLRAALGLSHPGRRRSRR
jgi:hypothetical protein